MNPTTNRSQGDSMFQGIEALAEFEKAEAESTSVQHSEEHKQSMKEDWNAFYNLRSEEIQRPVEEMSVSRIELTETIIETSTSHESNLQPDLKPMFAVENAKGSGSSMEEAGLKLDFLGLGKEVGKGLFGALGLFREIFMDTVTMVAGKKDKKAKKHESDPKKAEENAKKEALKQKKKTNWGLFNQALSAQAVASPVAVEAVRMDSQEKSKINLTIKTQESYKGIKDRFGRLTVYASSMFERAQLDEEKKIKKQEKEMKIASLNKNPDLNMDKAAEGGFLSSTGGQGAG